MVVTVRTRVAFGVLGAVQVTLIAGITALSVALPAIRHDLGLTAAEVALVSSAYGIAFAGLLLLGGRIADLYGHRRVLVVGIALFVGGSVVVMVAGNLVVMVGARFVQGMGLLGPLRRLWRCCTMFFPTRPRGTVRVPCGVVWLGLVPLAAFCCPGW
ncbi:hypothetical protein GCM10029964_094340 [Kibdelosporangium lantanae]